MGTQLPLAPACNFRAYVYCGQTSGWIKMPLGMEIGLGQGHIVLDGDPGPRQKMGHSPLQFSAHVYCGQTAGWIKMSLGMEVGLGPGDFVLDGDRAPTKRDTAPSFRPVSIVIKRLDGSRCHWAQATLC